MPDRLDVWEPTSLVRGGEPFRRGAKPLDLSFLDPIEERERGALGAVDIGASFQRRRAASGITRSFGPTGSRTPGVKAKTLADLISGSIEGQATRRSNVVLGQEGRRASLIGSDLMNTKAFFQSLAGQRWQAELNHAIAEAQKSGGGFMDFVDLGLRLAAAIPGPQQIPAAAATLGREGVSSGRND